MKPGNGNKGRGRKRFKRQDPARTEPIRKWSGLFQTGAQTSESGRNGIRPEPPSETATQAINLGYRVLEEHLAQGRRVAQSLSKGTYRVQNAGAEIQEFLQRAVRYTAEIMPLWLDLMNSMASSEAMRSFLAPAPNPSAPPNREARHPNANVTVEMRSSRPAAVRVELMREFDSLPLVVQSLRSVDSGVEPISEVSLVLDNTTKEPLVRVAIPEDQPAGVYTGVVVVRDSGEPAGVVTVRLSER